MMDLDYRSALSVPLGVSVTPKGPLCGVKLGLLVLQVLLPLYIFSEYSDN